MEEIEEYLKDVLDKIYKNYTTETLITKEIELDRLIQIKKEELFRIRKELRQRIN